VDHAVAQQIASGPNPKLRTYTQATLTKIFWKIISAAKEDDTSAVSAACAALLRKCQALNYDYRDFQIASSKKRTPKRG
jgi:DNA/RNA endonuclease G (NUC1)